MNATLIQPESSEYPTGLKRVFGERPLPPVSAIGNRDLLRCRALALFCSIKCPGEVILRTYDLIRSIRDARIPMIGGFHSPMEKECLTLLLRGTQPVIVCPARSIEGMRLRTSWKTPLAAGRLLILSPFPKKYRRITAELSETRNRFVAALAEQILVTHAGAGSKTERFFQALLSWRKPIWVLSSKENEHLVAKGAKPLESGNLSGLEEDAAS
jgi:predicted Rossmann fold nucleotide-binding protein DprA/Smf involved in DNA uptake